MPGLLARSLLSYTINLSVSISTYPTTVCNRPERFECGLGGGVVDGGGGTAEANQFSVNSRTGVRIVDKRFDAEKNGHPDGKRKHGTIYAFVLGLRHQQRNIFHCQ